MEYKSGSAIHELDMKPAVNISSPYFLFRDPFLNNRNSEGNEKLHPSKDLFEFIIIEDELPIANVEKINLLKVFKGFNINIFTEPAEAIKNLKNTIGKNNSGKIRVLFLDLYMPEISGFDILDAISQLSIAEDQLYVYVLSGSLNDRDIRKAINHKITDGFISKPLTIESISEFFALSNNYSDL